MRPLKSTGLGFEHRADGERSRYGTVMESRCLGETLSHFSVSLLGGESQDSGRSTLRS